MLSCYRTVLYLFFKGEIEMRYWVYINDKVEGPFTEDKLVTLQGFTPDTLICSEDAANSGNQEWVKASTLFEFDQEETPASSDTPAVAQGQAPAATQANANDALAAVLLAKLDSLTNQLSDLQSKLDGMQVKLDESISAQQKASSEAAERADALAAQVDAFATTTRNSQQDSPFMDGMSALSLEEEQSAEADSSSVEELNTGNSIDLDATVDLEDESQTDTLSGKTEDDVVLNAALTSLHEKQDLPKTKPNDSEETFQDLLNPDATPEQEAGSQTPASADNDKKEAILAEFSAPASSDEVVDQVIKEKEAEKSQEKEKEKQSISKRLIAAGAAAASAAATFVGLKSKEEPKQPKPVAEEQPATDPVTDLPSLEAPVPAQETPAQTEQVPELADLTPVEETPATDPTPAQQPATEPAPQPTDLSATATAENVEVVIPSLDGGVAASAGDTQEEKESTMQELVPGAKVEQSDSLITEADLAEAFADRSSTENQSVEQLFGLADATAQVNSATSQPEPENTTPQDLPSIDSMDPSRSAAEDVSSQADNPNELTEIELKEGSTYLISDFVPPASSDALEQAYAKRDGQTVPAQNKTNEKTSDKSDNLEIQEFVATPQKQEGKTETPVNKEAEATVTVSQIILENTIKAKRGAALDIKTVPMVPEPAKSDRLQIEGLEDDINTQHDLKSADVQPAGKTAKIVVGTLIALLLAGVIYGLLGFMELIPARFNILAPSQETAATEQEAQLNEMLGPTELEDSAAPTAYEQTAAAALPQDTQQTQQDIVLKEVQEYMLTNGYTLKQFIESKHPAMVDLITWNISNAVEPDTYSILVKVPPENRQSFKLSYRFNYNAISRALEPTTSDARNLLSSIPGR